MQNSARAPAPAEVKCMQDTNKPGPPTGAAVEARNRRLGTRPARGDRREPAARPLALAGWEMAVVASTALAAPGAGRSVKEVRDETQVGSLALACT